MNTKRITVGVAAAAAWNNKNKKNGNMLLGTEEELSLLNLWSRARKGVKREEEEEEEALHRIHLELPHRRCRRQHERVAECGGATSATMRSC